MNKDEEKSFISKLFSTSDRGIQGSTGRIYPRSRLIGLILAVILVIYGFTFIKKDGAGSSELSNGSFYSVIFDAGSTGSRIHVYTFTKETGKLELLDELFEQVKPGLSSYAEDIPGAIKSIDDLLQHAKDKIPSSQWADTPLELKATAGLRLLKPEQAEGILDGVRKLLKDSPFKVGDNAVEIMEGSDEGINAWMTINFLLGSLGGSGLEHTVPTIDLGGGSMQLTFHPKEDGTSASAPEGYVLQKTAFGDTFDIYTHSYLGLGLMSAREQLFGGPPSDGSKIVVQSPCFKQGKSITWSNAKHDYEITGSEGGYQACLGMASSAVNKNNIDKPKEIINGEIFAFSYFFDRASEAGLIDAENGGKTKVQSFRQAAEKACSSDDSSEWQCTDLCLISAILDAFGLPEDQNLQIAKKINGAETQWTLGDSFHLM